MAKKNGRRLRAEVATRVQDAKHSHKPTNKSIQAARFHRVREVLREFDGQIDVEHTSGGHLKIMIENAEPVFASCSPSDYRALRNMRAMIRRALRTVP